MYFLRFFSWVICVALRKQISQTLWELIVRVEQIEQVELPQILFISEQSEQPAMMLSGVYSTEWNLTHETFTILFEFILSDKVYLRK